MTLKKILSIIGKKRAAAIAGCGSSASWHWYQTGLKQKIPDTQALIAWADHLKLSDAELGELVRDAHVRRVEIMEQLAEDDRMHIRARSVLRRDLAKEIAQEISDKDPGASERALKREADAARLKEEYLSEEGRLRRLASYQKKLDRLRRRNGNN